MDRTFEECDYALRSIRTFKSKEHDRNGDYSELQRSIDLFRKIDARG